MKKGPTLQRALSFHMARPERFELPAFWFVARRSIQLSYGRVGTRILGGGGGGGKKAAAPRPSLSRIASVIWRRDGTSQPQPAPSDLRRRGTAGRRPGSGGGTADGVAGPRPLHLHGGDGRG